MNQPNIKPPIMKPPIMKQAVTFMSILLLTACGGGGGGSSHGEQERDERSPCAKMATVNITNMKIIIFFI